jgi:hypothetical protein
MKDEEGEGGGKQDVDLGASERFALRSKPSLDERSRRLPHSTSLIYMRWTWSTDSSQAVNRGRPAFSPRVSHQTLCAPLSPDSQVDDWRKRHI